MSDPKCLHCAIGALINREFGHLSHYERLRCLVEIMADAAEDSCKQGGVDRAVAVMLARVMFEHAFGQIERGQYKLGAAVVPANQLN